MERDRDGNTYERCSECKVRVPYPRSMCRGCERALEKSSGSVGPSRAAMAAPGPDDAYLALKGARERLCRAQLLVPNHWRSTLDEAVAKIDEVGSTLSQWSRFDQPEYADG